MKTTYIKKLYLSLVMGTLFLLSALCFAMGHSFATVANAAAEITIDIDTLSYNENLLPKGVEGKSYPVFACSAVDKQGNEVKDIDVVVYNPEKALVPIKDNRFSTSSVGKYNIVYKATKDKTEVSATLIVTVVAESEYTAPYYTFNDAIVSSSATGKQVSLYQGAYGGGNGELTVSSALSYEGEYPSQEAQIENYGLHDYFIPTVEGTYTVKYFVTDIVGETVTAEKVVSVTDSLQPVLRQPSVSTSGLVGEKMSFEHAQAVVYVDGKQIYVPVKVYVNDTDVTSTMNYTPTSKGVYTVKYEAVNVLDAGRATAVFEQQVKVTDAAENKQNKKPYIQNYFNLNGLEGSWRAKPESNAETVKEYEYNVYVLKATGNLPNVSAQFTSAVPAQYANMELGLDVVSAEFSNLYFTYTDYIDGEKQVTVCLKKNSETPTMLDVYVGGVYKATLEKYAFCFAIDCETGVLTETVSATEICKITSYDNGTKFDGFDNGRVYMSVSAEGVTSNFVLKLYTICTQNVSSATSDNGKPFFIVPNLFSNAINAEFGKEYTIKPLTAFDLSGADVTVSAMAIAPDGTTLFSGTVDGNSKITLSQYGSYSIVYQATDKANNVREFKCTVMITDRTAPTVSTVEIPSKVKVGETFLFPEATVSDNATKEVASWVYVTICEDYQKIIITAGEYTFAKAGTYLVTYGAEDDAGNITVLTYTVVCE